MTRFLRSLALALLMFAIGLNLSGLYELRFAPNAGDALTARGGVTGSFFTGVLAVLVATPCTAPFMCAAAGYALADRRCAGPQAGRYKARAGADLHHALAATLNHKGVAVIDVTVSKEENVFPIVPAGANARDMIVQ